MSIKYLYKILLCQGGGGYAVQSVSVNTLLTKLWTDLKIFRVTKIGMKWLTLENGLECQTQLFLYCQWGVHCNKFWGILTIGIRKIH